MLFNSGHTMTVTDKSQKNLSNIYFYMLNLTFLNLDLEFQEGLVEYKHTEVRVRRLM